MCARVLVLLLSILISPTLLASEAIQSAVNAYEACIHEAAGKMKSKKQIVSACAGLLEQTVETVPPPARAGFKAEIRSRTNQFLEAQGKR